MLVPVVAALALSTASAIAPSERVYQGLEPQRRQWNHPGEQARLSGGEAWKRFVAEAGPGWTAEWDEATGTPRQAWGDGVALRAGTAPGDGPAIQAAVGALLADHAALFGFEPGTLAPGRLEHHAESDTWYVSFDHYPGGGADGDPADLGVPVYRGGISARVKHGNLVMLSVHTAPEARLVGAWTVDAGVAIRHATAQGPAPAATHLEPSAQRVLLERRGADGELVLARVWQVETRTGGPYSTDPVGTWVSFVDAATGELLHVHNAVLFVNGSVDARHHERSPVGPFVTSPMPLVRVQGSSTTYADDAGNFTLGSGPFTVLVDGSYAAVENAAGNNGGVQTSSANIVLDNGDATQAEIDTYVFLHQAREWGLAVESGNGMARIDLQAYVNIGDFCNAYFDGNVNFFQAGGPCTNTGQNMDVVHHEWGHGFHYYQIRAGTFDNSLSEGAADSVAFFQSGSPQIGPDFFNNGAPVRTVTDFRVYPQDYDDRADPHENGLIFAGAMWDLWGLLVAAEGTTTGTNSATNIFAGLLRGGSDIAGSYAEALVGDDNDGNLGNGTPHKCQIDESFGRHGLGPGGGGSGGITRATHEAIVAAVAGEEQKARFVLPEANACSSGIADDAVIHWRVNEGNWNTKGARVDGARIDATLPAFDEGDFVEYWLDGTDTRGNTFQSPPSGRVGAFTFYVGETMEVYCDNFSSGPGGFRAKADRGEDDWGYGVPTGEAGDPTRGLTGQKIWGTDINGDGLYASDTQSRLKSPILSTGHYEGVFLQYARWLAVEDRAFDGASIKLSGGGREPETRWSNSGTPEQDGNLADDQWMVHAVDLGGGADRSSEVTIDFAIDTDGGAEFAGWNIDDFCLLAPATPDNRLGVGDLAAQAVEGSVRLTWSQPAHESATQVVVVRRTDRLPTGPTDGVVVGTFDGFEPREPADLVDVVVQGDLYYAVYGTDGSDWSSFTIEGLNAVALDDVPPAPGAGGIGVGTGETATGTLGCGCDDTGSPAGLLGLGVVALLASRRRRA